MSMTNLPKFRPIEQQFEAEKVHQIREIQKLFQSLRFQAGATPYYSSEIIKCLEAGLLLAALQVAATLAELFARDLLLAERYKREFSQKPTTLDSNLGKIEREIEDGRPLFYFNKIISELAEYNVIDEQDKDEIYNFYKNVRIPLHHGLTRRFVRSSSNAEIEDDDNPLAALFFGQSVRSKAFEEILEDNTLNYLRDVGNFIEKYLPFLDDFYSG